MKNPVQWLRSAVFLLQMYLAMLVLGLLFAPWAAVSPKGARTACKSYARWVLWTARWMVGIQTEVRGQVPSGEVIVAAKHQSFLDILIIFNAVPSARFIMKRELMWTPVIGVYAKRLGCVPVNRGRRGSAIAKMVKDVAAQSREPGQLIIYSQGTRVAPGARKPYKIGTAVLYEGLSQPCVPAATNVGVFWPRKGIYRKPGLAVVEFLEPMQPGSSRDEFMAQLEMRVESRSDDLMREAGFDPGTAEQRA
ncbi:1-acyl-sn-glycerol-3-phosphate acyltransferase [Leisingera sp. HS039]|uniref:lysophospholipid acyltransferase family protein n=1 Tax=unclassified Leisingera TaxID=2614906 RepID=UPI001071498C|nr:lysophospholipid acyltransferase family protein [Leisingera sp. NJS201]MBQ4823485.1 1-acyl-sn-glycerol-3-phosphate acyltransferase [Leisingera sp. HS039]MCF6430821.1 1-acyl-sn-glycerol-3-phosphate acyltransferase [Leisingera sp. MMG026]QBR37423.1 1-acyl-sn-glycerol-3-phosphate acyltransferase [Leisingera sp. NJS201]